MKSTFSIEGMTCAGCAAKVTYTLKQMESVTDVQVDLNSKIATLEADRSIALTEVQSTLAPFPKYAVASDIEATKESALKPIGWRTYWPLVLIGLFISMVATGITLHTEGNMTAWMELFMGGFFLVFSFFKFLDIRGFASSYQSYDLLASAVPAYGYVYPFLELGLGMAWAFQGGTMAVAASTVLLMGFSAIGVIMAVARKQAIQCACLGTVFNLPMSTVTIVEDLLMVAMAGALLLP
jgi:copper chaperone CopZ